METVKIYITASVKSKMGAYTYILEVERDGNAVTLTKTEREEKEVTENQIAIIALGKALERMSKKCNLTIYTDSAHIKTAIQQGWIDKWKANQWNNAKGKPVANKDEWIRVDELLQGHTVQVTTESHSYRKWMETATRKEIRQ